MSRVYIIAEAGVNHNGDIQMARRLVDAAKTAGADAVKFQTFKTEKILTRGASMTDYQKENLSSLETQFEMIKSLELKHDDFALLKDYAESIGIEFLSTPDDDDSLDFLADQLNLPWLKIGSGEVTNLPFLRRIARKQRRMILSTGMSTIGEVERAVRTIREINSFELLLLHCTTNYPCPPEEVNLRAMKTLRRAFNLRVGYSDHTIGNEVPVAAVALGAEVIEKHITLDKEMAGPDHRASLDPAEFAMMVKQIRAIEVALGNGVKWPNPSEERIKQLVRRRVVAARDLPMGTIVTWQDLAFKRANDGIYVDQADSIIGSRLKASLSEDSPLFWSYLEDIPFVARSVAGLEVGAVSDAHPAHASVRPPSPIEVSLVPATSTDIDFLFQLKSEADSIYWGGFAKAPEYESLRRHYEQTLRDRIVFTMIIHADSIPAGVLSYRFDAAGDCIDYSINISKLFSGKGVGHKALANHAAWLRQTAARCRRIVALIRDDNARSQRIFGAAGYVQTDHFEDRCLGAKAELVRLHAWVKSLD